MHDRSGEKDTAYFELSFSPNVSLVSTVRRFVSDFWIQILPSAEITSQLAVATHELLDNAVLYSFDGNTSIRIDVTREAGAAEVVIATRNRASRSNIQRLCEALDELRSATDPPAFYQKMMHRTAARAEGSGLGLARVRSESDMVIGYEIEGDVVHLRATARFPLEVR
jgi:anti-sigma regulatory factor (Ser/Thr protein kinase)